MVRPDPAICPLCDRPNGCAMAQGGRCEDCWCAAVTIDRQILEQIPAPSVDVACICAECASARTTRPRPSR